MLASLGTLLFSACPSGAIQISSVSVSSQSFSPIRGQAVSFEYSLDMSATVSVAVFDPDFFLVKHLSDQVKVGKGIHSEEWDGRDMDGIVVPDEAFFITIVAQDEEGNMDVYDPTTFSGGEEFDITSAKVEPGTNTIVYSLERPSRMLIRVGIKGGPLMAAPVNWEPRVSGEITEYWKGKDQDDLMNLMAHPEVRMLITGFFLTDNSVITYGNSETDYYEYSSGKDNDRPKKPARPSVIREEETKISTHYMRPRLLDKRVEVYLSFPEADDKSDPISISPNKELVRVELSAADKANLVGEPFEVSFFLDGEYYSEEEVGYTPYNWLWNTGNVDEGEHLLTVNVSSFKDIIGIRSHKIRIAK